MTAACENLLLFGGVPSSYLADWEITHDLPMAEAKLGVRFVPIPQEELRHRYMSLDETAQRAATRLAEGLVDGAHPHASNRMPAAPNLGAIIAATKLYVAMDQIYQQREGDAVSVACSPWIHGEDLPVPCTALMLFQEEGIPATCQTDIDALLTMVMVKRATGLASFMGGAIKAQGKLGINHCVICRNLAGPESPQQPYTLSNYHGRKESPTVWAEVPTGKRVTVARLTKGLNNLLLLSGILVANQTHNTRCRNTLVIDVPNRDRVFKAVKGVQNHYVVAVGDHTQTLSEMAQSLDIEVVRLDQE